MIPLHFPSASGNIRTISFSHITTVHKPHWNNGFVSFEHAGNIVSTESTTPTIQHNPLLNCFPLNPKFHPTNLSRAVPSLRRLTSSGTAIVHLARVVGVVAAVLDRGGISVVGVDARELAAVLGNHALNVHVTLAHGRALFAVSGD